MAIQRINLGTAPSGTGGDTNRSAFKKIDDNFVDSANAASRQVGTAAGNVMEVGAFGLGGQKIFDIEGDYKDINTSLKFTQFFRNNSNNTAAIKYGSSIFIRNGNTAAILSIGYSTPDFLVSVWYDGITAPMQYKLLNTANTFTDSNGFIKAASPIIKLFADKIEPNDEAAQQKITFEKLGVGDYLIKGSTGFAQEGWYIEMPKDANGNVLVAVVYEQLDNNDISVKTYAKMFDPDTGDIVANTAKPRDIPATRWIDLRLEPLPQPDIKPFSADDTVNTNAE